MMIMMSVVIHIAAAAATRLIHITVVIHMSAPRPARSHTTPAGVAGETRHHSTLWPGESLRHGKTALLSRLQSTPLAAPIVGVHWA